MGHYFWRTSAQVLAAAALVCAALAVFSPAARIAASEHGAEIARQSEQSSPDLGDSLEEAAQKSVGCATCHNPMDSPSMHPTGTVRLGCTDCHGGNAQIALPVGVTAASPQYQDLTRQAHPRPRFADDARSSA